MSNAFDEPRASPRTLAGATGLKAIGDILFNQFAPANLDRIDIDVDVVSACTSTSIGRVPSSTGVITLPIAPSARSARFFF